MLVRSARIVVTVAAVVAASVGATYWAATQGWFEPQGQVEARQEQAPPPERPIAPPPERPDGPSPFGGLREALNPNWVEARAPFAPQEAPAAEPPPLPSDPPAPLDFDVPIPAPRPPNLVREETIPLPPIRPRDLPAVVAALTPPNAPAPETAGPQPAAYAPGGLAPPDEKPPLTPLPEPSGDFRRGAQVFVRIYKKESQLELWMRKGGRYALYKTFPICAFSGKLGPKIRQGDRQAPEGFYNVSARQLNPKSAYHLAFNVGFPNALERQKRWSGSALMVHGDCKSVGCYAMTNKGIEEIYSFVDAALRGGQREVPVHIFPFRMTQSNIDSETKGGFFSRGDYGQWTDFWQNLKEGHDLFEQTREPPQAYACAGRYAFNGAGRACSRIAGW